LKPSKKLTPDVPMVIETKDHVIEAIAWIGRIERDVERIQTEMNTDLSAIRETYETEAASHGDVLKGLRLGVEAWCEANRSELTDDGKTKTVQLASGEISWRTRPARVSLKGVDDLLAEIKRLGLDTLVRVKEEISKEAILANPNAVVGIKGIKIERGEDFVIKPFREHLEGQA
jgi:phage host-nuclease inhibitor protein Gam